MFSSKSICDNMLSKVESEFNSNKNDIEKNVGDKQFQKVEIKSENIEVNNSTTYIK